MSAHLYFVGGAHGTGKSSLCRKLAEDPAFVAVSASDLIRHQPEVGDPTGKAVADIDGNQRRLLAALEPYRRSSQSLLVDGHYCLLTSDGHIAPIPASVFRQMSPDLLILVDAAADVVAERLAARDQRPPDNDTLAALLNAEREHAHLLGRALAIPLITTTWPEGLQQVQDALTNATGI